MLFAGFLVAGVFIYAGEKDYLLLFITILIVSVSIRIFITFYINKNVSVDLEKFARYYVIASLFLGLNFSFITLVHYGVEDPELRIFMTIINIGLITAAIATLAVWMKAYIAFALPQIFSLFGVYILNDNIYVALSTIVFSVLMLKVAKDFNTKFKESRLLIDENIKLISGMTKEIQDRKKAQLDLENHKTKLEEMIQERTKELEEINYNLENQIKIRQVVEKELEFLAYNDELTGLPNRTLFVEQVKSALLQAKRNETLLSILFIDLDRFKNINDSHGHNVGDNLLKKVASRLQVTLRDSDTVARNGGDEFSILIENMKDIREPFVVANKIIDSMNKKFEVDGHKIHIGASVGISTYPLDSDDPLELLKLADTAMYEAKKEGGNHFQFYSSTMSNQITDRLMLETALHSALENNEFFLVYQPQVNANTNKTEGFEALIRWDSSEYGLISPTIFIPILEDTGLIYSVGEWIIFQVLNFIKEGKSNNIKVSINLSALQCGVANYSSKIKEFIDNVGIDPKLVEFEVTESLLISDFNSTEMFLTDISRLGCTIALDDFGTGYTSFSYLTKLPIDIIKVDRSLITDIHENKNLQDIVKAIITMSKSLNIENVFEGIETKDELDMITEISNEAIIQGFYFSKPLNEDAVCEWFINQTNSNIS